MKYRAGMKTCDCHPETCCHLPWSVYSPEGKVVDAAWEKVDADKIAKGLNAQVRLKKQADQAMVWDDVNKLKKLIKQLAKQLQV